VTTDHTRDFILVAREHLASFEQSLLALEKAPNQAEICEQVDRGLRAIHSIKGDAGFLGFVTVRSLAHAMENSLERFRGGSEAPSAHVVEALLSARDRLVTLVEDPERSRTADIADALNVLGEDATTGSPVELDIDLSIRAASAGGRLVPFFRELARLGSLHDPRIVEAADLTSPLSGESVRLQGRLMPTVPPGEIERVIGASERSEGAAVENVYPIRIDLDAWARGAATPLARLIAELATYGRLAKPHLDYVTGDLTISSPTGPIVLRGELHSATPLIELQTRLRLPQVRGDDPTGPAATEEGPNLHTTAPSAAAAPTASSPELERLSSLRISIELLDRLMTLVGELTLVRNQSLIALGHEEGTQRNIIQRLNSVTSELQDTVLRTRMQPVGNLFGKFPRMVRDLARQLGKQVEVVTTGREVELDKTVLEQLSDPLTHLIRNSMDHGIESPEERVAKGKPPTGHISLSATPVDGQVQIEIRDDGRGIDPAAIKAKALALRLKTEAELQRMSDRDLLSLILLPGFSTAKTVTDVSGRGVGMDVVKTNVAQLEGSLTIDSTSGTGTTMVLRVPLTLAIIPCLVVDVGDERYAVPQRELEEVVCLHPGGKGSIEHAFDSEVFRLRDMLLPIVRFREVLQRVRPFTPETKAEVLRTHDPAERDPNRVEYIVVLRSGGKRFGLLVDSVRGTQEVVVKPMHASMKRLGVFAGATLMGDGRVALIANVDGIVAHAKCFGIEARLAASADTREPSEIHRILIFECGPQEQFALPLVQIRRIESIDVNRIECVGDHEFVTLEGVATRIVRLDKILQVSPCPQQPTMYLILPKFVPEPIGILISRIVDTDSLSFDLQQATVPDPGVLGTALVRGRLSLFLDVQYIRERVFGTGRADARIAEEHVQSGGRRRVLLIDDTPFFREVVKRYLEGVGIAVTTAVDGEDGLRKLAGGDFEMVVSDIEMPNVDGWSFAQTARARGYRLPFLALTSLSKSENEGRARTCGFDEFQEKLDHDQLIRVVERMLQDARAMAPAGGRA
jgi:two-component system chemotaxis sensor kinase CheA